MIPERPAVIGRATAALLVHLRELCEGRGCLVEHRDPLAAQQVQEQLGRTAHVVGHDHQPAAVEQRSPDLERGGVERHDDPCALEVVARRRGGPEERGEPLLATRVPLPSRGRYELQADQRDAGQPCGEDLETVGELLAQERWKVEGAGPAGGRHRGRRRDVVLNLYSPFASMDAPTISSISSMSENSFAHTSIMTDVVFSRTMNVPSPATMPQMYASCGASVDPHNPGFCCISILSPFCRCCASTQPRSTTQTL